MPFKAGLSELPRWMLWAFKILGVPAALFVALALLSRTWAVWLGWSGVNMIGLLHWQPILVLLAIFAWLLIVVWVVVAAIVVAVRMRARRGSGHAWASLALIAVLVLLPQAPPACLEAPFVAVFGAGRSPAEFLWVGADQRSRLLVRAVLMRGGDINARAEAGSPVIKLAACQDDPLFVAWLITEGADPNASDNMGYLPLTCAVGNGHLAVVEVLLRAGADPRAITAAGESVLDIAVEQGDPKIIQAIRAAIDKK